MLSVATRGKQSQSGITTISAAMTAARFAIGFGTWTKATARYET